MDLHIIGWLRIPYALHKLVITNDRSANFHVQQTLSSVSPSTILAHTTLHGWYRGLAYSIDHVFGLLAAHMSLLHCTVVSTPVSLDRSLDILVRIKSDCYMVYAHVAQYSFCNVHEYIFRIFGSQTLHK